MVHPSLHIIPTLVLEVMNLLCVQIAEAQEKKQEQGGGWAMLGFRRLCAPYPCCYLLWMVFLIMPPIAQSDVRIKQIEIDFLRLLKRCEALAEQPQGIPPQQLRKYKVVRQTLLLGFIRAKLVSLCKLQNTQ